MSDPDPLFSPPASDDPTPDSVEPAPVDESAASMDDAPVEVETAADDQPAAVIDQADADQTAVEADAADPEDAAAEDESDNEEALTEAESVPASSWTEYAPTSDEIGIDAALAAVAMLSAAPAADRQASADETDDVFGDVPERAETVRPARLSYTVSDGVPPMAKLRRGSPGSIIPALALIGLGGWLTFVTTTGGTVEPVLVAGSLIATVILSLFAYWISTGRWSRGTLMAAVFVLLVTGLVIVTAPPPILNALQPPPITLVDAYPLIVSAFGLALLAGGLLSRPRLRAAFGPGLVLLIAGIVGLLVNLRVIPQPILDTAAQLWFVPVVILVILLLLPLVFRMRERG